MKRIIFTTTILLLAAMGVFSDIPRPEKPSKPVPKPKSVNTSMTILLDRNATEARLLIPKSQIKQLRAELEQLDDESDNNAAVTGSFSRTQTIVSGMFLSLAFVFGGFWFIRSGKVATKTGKALMVIAVVAGIGSAATIVYANAGPPPAARSITSRIFDKDVFTPYRFASGKIKIEASDDTTVQLIVPDPPEESRKGEE